MHVRLVQLVKLNCQNEGLSCFVAASLSLWELVSKNSEDGMKKVFSSYTKAVRVFALGLAVLLGGAIFSCALVLPIWFFAEKFPHAYTVTVTVILCLALAFLLFGYIRKSIKQDRKKFLRFAVTFGTFTFFILFSLYALFNFSRLVALLLFLTPFLLFFIAEVFKVPKTKTENV